MWLRRRKNIVIRGKLILSGIPIVEIDDDASLEILGNVTLTSRNRRYHLNLHSPVKLLADRPGAKIRIGENSRIHGTCIHACRSVSIGSNCLIAANSQIVDSNGHELSFDRPEERIRTMDEPRPVTICDNVWIGANCFILPGVTIGEGSVIAANSVVRKDVPPRVLAGGNPAVVIRDFSAAEPSR